MDQRIINLYDRFTHGGMSRRDFFERLVGLAGGTAAATALLQVLENDYAHAALDPFRSLFRWMPAFLVVLVALIGVIVFIARRPLRSARNAA